MSLEFNSIENISYHKKSVPEIKKQAKLKQGKECEKFKLFS